jgi:hypothetical protein
MANRVSPPLALTAALSLEGNKWGVHLTWRGPPDPGYDRVNIAWGIGNSLTAPMPDSASFDGNQTSYTIHGALPSTSYLFGVEGGVEDGAGGHDYSQWAKIIVATPFAPPSIPPGGREIVFYSRNGAAWMAPLAENSPGDVRIGNTHQIGGWEGDWKQVVGFNDAVGNPFVLFYKDGAAFAAPVVLGARGPQNGNAKPIDNFPLGTAWTQIAAFKFNQMPFLLLYSSSGAAFVAPIINGAKGPALGKPNQIGGWEGDWTQIATFHIGGTPFIFFYRGRDTAAFVAPIIQGASGPQNGASQRFDFGELKHLPGSPATHWTQIESFDFNGSAYLLRYEQASGTALVAPFVGATLLGTAHRIGGWQTNWVEIASLSFM